MLITTRDEIKDLREKSGLSWTDIGNATGRNRYAARSMYRDAESLMVKGYVRMVEAMGYDIKMRFVKR